MALVAAVFTEAGGGGREIAHLGYLAACLQWGVLIALGIFVTASVQQRTYGRGEDRPQPYAEATRLLTQLRAVARQLPGATLDPGGIAEHLLEELRTIARADRAAVLSASGGGRLVVLAQIGVETGGLGDDPGRRLRDRGRLGEPAAADGSRARRPARTPAGPSLRAGGARWSRGSARSGWSTLEADRVRAYPPPVVRE